MTFYGAVHYFRRFLDTLPLSSLVAFQEASMSNSKHSLKIKTKYVEATAEGYGVVALFLLAAAAVVLKLLGLW